MRASLLRSFEYYIIAFHVIRSNDVLSTHSLPSSGRDLLIVLIWNRSIATCHTFLSRSTAAAHFIQYIIIYCYLHKNMQFVVCKTRVIGRSVWTVCFVHSRCHSLTLHLSFNEFHEERDARASIWLGQLIGMRMRNRANGFSQTDCLTYVERCTSQLSQLNAEVHRFVATACKRKEVKRFQPITIFLTLYWKNSNRGKIAIFSIHS